VSFFVILQKDRIHAIEFIQCYSSSNFSLFFVFGFIGNSAYFFVFNLMMDPLVMIILLFFLLVR